MSEDLIPLLMKHFKVEYPAAQELAFGLNDAIGYQEQMGGMFCEPLTITEYSDELALIFNALKKIEKNLKKIGSANCGLLDTNYHAANNKDSSLLSIESYEQSGYEIITNRLMSGIEYTINHLSTPGSGQQRRQATQYIAGISKLACWFQDIFPNNKLSTSQGSKFYKYVAFWFEHSMNIEIQDLRRHIHNTLNDKRAKLKHD